MPPILITAAASFAQSLISKIWPDPAAQAEAQRKLLELQQSGEMQRMTADLQVMLAQADINKIEAASESVLKSGWRPFIGWACGAGFLYQFLLRPIINAVAIWHVGEAVAPSLEGDTLMSVTAALLGLGTLRTFEKTKGVN